MRKLSTIFLFLFGMGMCNVSNVHAQIGIRAGVNFSNIVGHNVGGENLNLKINTGFHVGGYMISGYQNIFLLNREYSLLQKDQKKKVCRDRTITLLQQPGITWSCQ